MSNNVNISLVVYTISLKPRNTRSAPRIKLCKLGAPDIQKTIKDFLTLYLKKTAGGKYVDVYGHDTLLSFQSVNSSNRQTWVSLEGGKADGYTAKIKNKNKSDVLLYTKIPGDAEFLDFPCLIWTPEDCVYSYICHVYIGQKSVAASFNYLLNDWLKKYLEKHYTDLYTLFFNATTVAEITVKKALGINRIELVELSKKLEDGTYGEARKKIVTSITPTNGAMGWIKTAIKNASFSSAKEKVTELYGIDLHDEMALSTIRFHLKMPTGGSRKIRLSDHSIKGLRFDISDKEAITKSGKINATKLKEEMELLLSQIHQGLVG